MSYKLDNETQLFQKSSIKYIAVLSFNKQPIGLIISQHNINKIKRLNPKIDLRVLLTLVNDDRNKNKRVAFEKWLKLRRSVFFNREEFREYNQRCYQKNGLKTTIYS